MGSARHDEVERKFDVGAAAVLPTLAGLDGVSTMGQQVEQLLEATYFDTPDLDLAAHGVTVRRRSGGNDAGWHVKIPRGKDTRTEVRLPLGDGTAAVPDRVPDRVPDEVLAPVRGLVRDRALVPVARVSTRRLEHALLGADGAVLAEVCDDQVRTERLHGPSLDQAWREWEVELVHGDRSVLDAVERRLLDAGATPAATASKLARSLGDAVPATPHVPSGKELSRASAAQVVRAYLVEHVAELQRQDRRLRADDPGAVHKLRIAARRLRAALRTYRPLFEPTATDRVADELRWLGVNLSQARDAQVLRERLRDLVAAEPPELVLGPVMTRIDDELRTAYRAGLDRALETLDGQRYFRLLDSLDTLVRCPPLTAGADAPAREVLPGLLHRDARRLRRAARAISRSADGPPHDTALHETRKKAKRLRYAAEAAVPVLGGPAETLAASAKQVQQTLGEHQDAVVAQHRLREHGVQAHVHGENGFTFGRLHALEQARAGEAEREFDTAWRARPGKNLRRWARR